MGKKFSVKRIIACMLAIITALTSAPLQNVYASETITAVVSDDGSTLIISGTGEMPVGSTLVDDYSTITNVIIEEGITSITTSAFKNWKNITSVQLPSTLTTIGNNAFYNCTALTQITIPKNVTSAKNAFQSSGLQIISFEDGMIKIPDYICYNSKKLTTVNIPESVIEIGNQSFRNCSALVNIVLPSNLLKIGEYAFCESKIGNIILPNSITNIGKYAFNNCDNILEITIPEGLTVLEENVFSDCGKLTTVNFSSNLVTIEDNVFYDCEALVNPNLPQSLVEIGECAFYNCISITEINLPANITTIGKQAFYKTAITEIFIPKYLISANTIFAKNTSYKNTTLQKITFEEGILSVPLSICAYCTALTEVNIPDSVTSIGVSAFNSCTALTEVNIPDSVTSIGNAAFRDCTALVSMLLPQNLNNIGVAAFYNTNITELFIPKTVTTASKIFCDSANSNTGEYSTLKKITFEDGMTTIPENICFNNFNLVEAVIPESVTEIGDAAFRGCKSLTEHTLPSNLTTIGGSVFYGCTSLTEIILPSNLTTIGHKAFYNTAIKEITIPKNVTSASGIFDGGTTAADGNEKLQVITFEEGMTAIPSRICEDCYILTTINIPDSVTTIESLAFNNCSSLTTFSLSDKIEVIDDRAFLVSSETLTTVYTTNKYVRQLNWLSSYNRNVKFIPDMYNITYTVDDTEYTSDLVVSGETTTEPEEPIVEGYKFLNWRLNGEVFDFNTPITEDIILVAELEENTTRTVTFLGINGEVLDTQLIEKGEYAVAPEVPTNEYSVFIGWDYDLTKPITENITINSIWKYTRTVEFIDSYFNNNSTQKVILNECATEPVAPIQKGYTFVGWSTSGSHSNLFDFNTPIEESITLYAVWTKNPITAIVEKHYVHKEKESLDYYDYISDIDKFIEKLGTDCYTEIINEQINFYYESYSWNNTTFIYDYDPFDKFAGNWGVLTRYDVDGNIASREIYHMVDLSTDIYGNTGNDIVIDFGEFGGRFDIYTNAEWAKITFAGSNPVYTNHDSENCELEKCLCKANTVRPWYITGFPTVDDLYGTYLFTPCQHNTAFSHLDLFKYVEYNEEYRGYVNKTTGKWEVSNMPDYGKFIGWTTSKNSTEVIDWNTVQFTENTVIYPVIENYNLSKVTFVDSNTDEVISVQYVSPYYGEGLTEPQRPADGEGLVFLGWSATGSGNDLFDIHSRPASDITVYSVYQKSYLVEFLVEKEDGTFEQWTSQWVGEYEKAAEPTAPEKEGYTFLGWFNGDVKYDFNSQVTSNISLIGKWQIKEFTIQFIDFDGQSVSIIKSERVKYGQSISEIEAPQKDGYEFIGWFNGNEKYDFTTPVKKEFTLVAKYEKHIHDFNIVAESKEATCIEKGYEIIKCSCGEHNRVDFELDFTNHVGETEVRGQKEATCTENGYTGDEYCKACNTLLSKGVETEKIEHIAGNAVEEKYVAPTTESKGSYNLVVYCKNCNTELSRITKEIPMLDPEPVKPQEPTKPETTEPEEPVKPQETEEPTVPEDTEEPESEEEGDPVTDEEPLYVGDTNEDTMSDIFGNFVEAVKTMAIVFSISLAAVFGVLGLLLLVLAWMKKVKVFNNTNTNMYSEDNYEVIFKTSVKTEGNRIAELFKKNDRVWNIIIPEETLNNRVTDSFKVEFNKFFCKRYNGEQLIIRLGTDENSRQIGFVIDEAENVISFTYED